MMKLKLLKNSEKILMLETNKSLTKGNVAVFPTTPFSAPKCGQSDDNLGFI